MTYLYLVKYKSHRRNFFPFFRSHSPPCVTIAIYCVFSYFINKLFKSNELFKPSYHCHYHYHYHCHYHYHYHYHCGLIFNMSKNINFDVAVELVYLADPAKPGAALLILSFFIIAKLQIQPRIWRVLYSGGCLYTKRFGDCKILQTRTNNSQTRPDQEK